MQKFTQISGTAVPMMKANIDTDVIIPAKRLVGHKREELAAFAFEAHRYRPDGSDNPDFVLNASLSGRQCSDHRREFRLWLVPRVGSVGDGRARISLRGRAGFR